MIRENKGFTLVELLITVFILAFVLAGASQMFVALLSQFKQQGKIAETNIEGIIGLELLRQDVGSAGYGLPWVVPSGLTYTEASAATLYNDAPASGTTGTNNNPRAILSGNGQGTFGFDDVLVIKSANIARNAACKKWTYLQSTGTKSWDISTENLSASDHVIVISPGVTNSTRRTLVLDKDDATVWKTTFNSLSDFTPPTGSGDSNFVYGIADASPSIIRMPFNRADYYILTGSTYQPTRCAPNTGVLVKAMISHTDGDRSDVLPLLDCVADMQVVFRLDTNADGVADNTAVDITGLNAKAIRDQVKEVLIYVLAHEGQKDTKYIHSPTTIYVGDISAGGGGHDYNIGANVNYRWKLYTLSVRLNNLR